MNQSSSSGNSPYKNIKGLWASGPSGSLHTGPIMQGGQVVGYSHKGYTGSTPEDARKIWQRAQLEDSPDRYVGRQVERNAALAGEVGKGYEDYGAATQQTKDQFNRWFSEFNNLQPTMRESLDQSLAAYDPQPLEAELRALEAQRGQNFEDANTRYTAADQAWRDAAMRSVRNAEQLAYDYEHKLGPKLRDYATDRAFAEAAARYGVPNEGRRSSDLDAALASAAYRNSLEIANQSYANNMDVLRNVRMPTEGQIRANEVSRIGSWEYPNRNALTDSKENMLWQLQNLRTQLAGRPLAEVQNYLRTIGIPAQYAQELMSGNLANLTALAQLDESAYYRGLEDRFGIDQVQPNNFIGGYPNLPAQEPSTPDVQPMDYGNPRYAYPDINPPPITDRYGVAPLEDAYGNVRYPSEFNARGRNAAPLSRVPSSYYGGSTGDYYMSGPVGGAPTEGTYRGSPSAGTGAYYMSGPVGGGPTQGVYDASTGKTYPYEYVN